MANAFSSSLCNIYACQIRRLPVPCVVPEVPRVILVSNYEDLFRRVDIFPIPPAPAGSPPSLPPWSTPASTTGGSGTNPTAGTTTGGSGTNPTEGTTTGGSGTNPTEGTTTGGSGTNPTEGTTTGGSGTNPTEGTTTGGSGTLPSSGSDSGSGSTSSSGNIVCCGGDCAFRLGGTATISLRLDSPIEDIGCPNVNLLVGTYSGTGVCGPCGVWRSPLQPIGGCDDNAVPPNPVSAYYSLQATYQGYDQGGRQRWSVTLSTVIGSWYEVSPGVWIYALHSDRSVTAPNIHGNCSGGSDPVRGASVSGVQLCS